jgi:hypothetical protein
MREPSETQPSAPVDLEELRQSHLSDGASPSRRAELLAQIAMIPRSEVVDSRGIRFPKLTSWALPLVFVSAAFSLAVGVWLGRQPGIYPESIGQARGGDANPKDDRYLAAHVTAAGCNRGRGDDGLLSDFEGGANEEDFEIPSRDGRVGHWFHTRNRNGAEWRMLPLRVAAAEPVDAQSGAADVSVQGHALRVAGAPPTGRGVNVGIMLSRCYDAEAYAGIEFKVRGTGLWFFNVQTLDSVPAELGGRCTHKCWFTGGRQVQPTDRFETYSVRWDDMTPPDPNYDMSLEVLQLVFSLQSGPEPYELWLDDVKFIEK